MKKLCILFLSLSLIPFVHGTDRIAQRKKSFGAFYYKARQSGPIFSQSLCVDNDFFLFSKIKEEEGEDIKMHRAYSLNTCVNMIRLKNDSTFKPFTENFSKKRFYLLKYVVIKNRFPGGYKPSVGFDSLVKESNEWLYGLCTVLSRRIKGAAQRKHHYDKGKEKGGLLETISAAIVAYLLGQLWYERPFLKELNQIDLQGQKLLRKIYLKDLTYNLSYEIEQLKK